MESVPCTLKSVEGNTARPVRCAGGHALPAGDRLNGVLLEPEVRNGEAGWSIYYVGDPKHLSSSQEASTAKIERTLAFASGHLSWIREDALRPPVKFVILPTTAEAAGAPGEGGGAVAAAPAMGYVEMSDMEVEQLPEVKRLIEAASKRALGTKAWADAQPRAAGSSGLLAFAQGLASPGGAAARGDKDKGKQPEEGESTLTGQSPIDLTGNKNKTLEKKGGTEHIASSLRVGEPLADLTKSLLRGQGLTKGDQIPVGGAMFVMEPTEWREYRSTLATVMNSFLEQNRGWQISQGLAMCADLWKEKHSHEAALAVTMAVAAMMACLSKFPRSKYREDKQVSIDLSACNSIRLVFITAMSRLLRTPSDQLEEAAKLADDASVQLMFIRKTAELITVMHKDCEKVEEKRVKNITTPTSLMSSSA